MEETNKHIKIKSLKELKEFLNRAEGQLDCFVILSIGKSSKTFTKQEDNAIVIVNEIDDTIDEYDTFEDFEKSDNIIIKAIEKRAFYLYSYEVKKVVRHHIIAQR